MIKCIVQVVLLPPFSQEEKAHYKKGIMASISEGPNLFFVPVPVPCVAILSGIYLITKMNRHVICGLTPSLLMRRQNPKRRSARVHGEKLSNLLSPSAHSQSL